MPQTTQDKRRVWANNGGTWGRNVPTYRHGDIITLNNLVTASNNPQRAFSGGLSGIVESRSVAATIPNGDGWIFDISSHNPAVYNDATRGKVMYNDYNGGTDLDASKTWTFSDVPENTWVYISRWVRDEILTTGSVPYPNDKQIQHKLGRLNYAQGISDDGDTNTGQELFSAIFYNSNGRQVRIENNATLDPGTITSGSTTTVINDTGKSWTVNSLRNRRVDIRKTADGTHQFGLIVSNTSNSYTLLIAITAPVAGDTYTLGPMQDYYGLTGLVPTPNSGWFMQEQFIFTGTQGLSDGQYTIRYRQNGVIVDDTKTGICMYGGTKRFIYPIHQDYWGNPEVAMTSKKNFSDDLYYASGSTTRLVLANLLNMNTTANYENQLHSAWSGNSATLEINAGAATPGAYYLCEVTGVNTLLSWAPFNLAA